MKRLALALVGVAAVTAIALAIHANRPAPAADSSVETSTGRSDAAPEPSVEPPRFSETVMASTEPVAEQSQPGRVEAEATSPGAKVNAGKLIFDQLLDALLSPRTTYEQKQFALKELKNSGKLDSAITALEQRVADDPRSVESVSALGQVYYKKAGQTEDVRERAILAMKADQTLEAALNLDPQNWDARFTKASGMSYWPPELNKGKEVLEELQTLIQQQEQQSPQPKFARAYIRLGEQYEKSGYPKYATDVWQRGAALFPADSDLKEKLASASH